MNSKKTITWNVGKQHKTVGWNITSNHVQRKSPITKQSSESAENLFSSFFSKQSNATPFANNLRKRQTHDIRRPKAELVYIKNNESIFTFTQARKLDIDQPDKEEQIPPESKQVLIAYNKTPKKIQLPNKPQTINVRPNQKHVVNVIKTRNIISNMYFTIPEGNSKGERILKIPNMGNPCGPVSFYHFIKGVLLSPISFQESLFLFNDLGKMTEEITRAIWNQESYDKAVELFARLESHFRSNRESDPDLTYYEDNIKPLLIALENDPSFQNRTAPRNRFVDVGILFDILKYTIRINASIEADFGNYFQFPFLPIDNEHPDAGLLTYISTEVFEMFGVNEDGRITEFPPYMILPTMDLDLKNDGNKLENIWVAAQSNVENLNAIVNAFRSDDVQRVYTISSCLISLPNHFMAIRCYGNDYDLFDTISNHPKNRYNDIGKLIGCIENYINIARHHNYKLFFLVVRDDFDPSEVSESPLNTFIDNNNDSDEILPEQSDGIYLSSTDDDDVISSYEKERLTILEE